MGELVLKKSSSIFSFPIVTAMQLHGRGGVNVLKGKWRDFPRSPVVWILHFHSKGHRFNPLNQGTKIPHVPAAQPNE